MEGAQAAAVGSSSDREGGGIDWTECKKRSDVWKHFLIDKNKKDKVKCKKCPTIIYNYKSATTNMWKHLERKHLMISSKKRCQGESISTPQTRRAPIVFTC